MIDSTFISTTVALKLDFTYDKYFTFVGCKELDNVQSLLIRTL